ncbi:MAG: phosphatase PAP2 family protein [Bacteroidales bacterium]|nr:phosphatase PAP2 family protein [Bacteroidales bacterium]
MLDTLISWDTDLFRLINNARSPFADCVFAIISSKVFIAVMVVVFTAAVMKKNQWKSWWLYILMVGLCFLLADRISVMCFKDTVCRLRPSHALEDVTTVRFLHWKLIYGYKGGLYGFVSSHAANIFAVITACFGCSGGFKQKKNLKMLLLMLIWGLAAGYSRVYCGYHYPGDVICGALLGVIIGYFVAMFINYLAKRLEKKRIQ